MYHGEVNVAQEELNSFLAVAEDLKVKGLTQGNNSSDSKSSHTAPPPRPDPPKARLPDPTPPPVKRPRPGPSPSQQPRQIAPSQPAYSQEQDDDIQEVAPIVKSEPASHVAAEAQYQQGQGIVADPNMEYGEEYGEYEGYEEGDYDTSMMDPNMAGADGNKGKIIKFPKYGTSSILLLWSLYNFNFLLSELKSSLICFQYPYTKSASKYFSPFTFKRKFKKIVARISGSAKFDHAAQLNKS